MHGPGRRWQRLHNEVPSQHPGLGGGGGSGAAQAAQGSASTDYRTKSAAYIACACRPLWLSSGPNSRLTANHFCSLMFWDMRASSWLGSAALLCRYLQDLKHQIGGKLVSLTPFDIESGPSSGTLSTKRRCGGAGRKCGWAGGVLITLLVVAILTMLSMRSHQQTSHPPPPPRLRPPAG